MSNGLYSGVSGLAIGIGLYRNVSGLWSGASGLVAGWGGSSIPYVSTDGYQVVMDSPADLSMTPVLVARVGYKRDGSATIYEDTVYLTKRIREPYPTSTSNLTPVFTPDRVALSDYIYANDSVRGITNNSAIACPKPVAQWVMPSRLTVSDTVDWEVTAFHREARSGQQVACVEVRANDGTNQTAWQTVGTTAVSTLCEDRNAVEVFKGTLDISSLADNSVIWLEARVKPWIGGVAAIRSTDDFTGAEEFSPRYFYRSTTRVSSPPYAYVSSTGDNTTGVWSTATATAAAFPFLTVAGALAAVTAQITTCDGGIIHIVDTVTMGTVSVLTAVGQKAGAVTVTRAPTTARSAAIVQISGTSMSTQLGVNNVLSSPLTEGALVFKDVSVQRVGALAFTSSTYASGTETKGLFLQWWNVNFDNGSQVSTYMSAGGRVNDAAFGFDMTNPPSATSNSAVFGVSSTNLHRLWRGFRGTMNKALIMGYAVVGSELTDGTGLALQSADKGSLTYANKWLKTPQNVLLLNPSDAVTVDRLVMANTLVEWTGSSTVFPTLQFCENSGNTSQAILHYNTFTGGGQAGRQNLLYDNQLGTPGRSQLHVLQSFKGNIFSQPNVKGDIFAHLSTAIGNYAYVHGVGTEGNWWTWDANAPASEDPTYVGRYSVSPPSPTAINDPLFTNYQGSTWNGVTLTPGAGGGTYTLTAGSPARDLVPTLMFSRDIAGNIRSGVQPAGAYSVIPTTLAMDFLASSYTINGTSYTFSQLVDFTRTSTGTYVNSSGFITATPASTNLILYTEAFDNAAWVKATTTVAANSTAAPDGTPTADTLTASGINATTRQTFTATAVPYTFSVYLMRKTGTGNVDITVDGTTYVTQTITSEWARYSTTLTPAAGSKTAGIRLAVSGDEVYVWGAQLELGSSASTYTKNFGGLYPPRFDYNPSTLAAKGVLIEPQSTNLFLYSEQFDNAGWSKADITVVANTAVSPDGTANADRLVASTSALAHQAYQTVSLTSGQAYTIVVYAKPAGYNYVNLRFGGGIASEAFFDVSNGTVVSATKPSNAKITPAGNGWYRCAYTDTATSTTTFIVSINVCPTSTSYTVAGDGTSGVYVWGAQLEALSYATSYIPTVGSTVTRTADSATIQAPMFDLWYNQTAGTFVFQFDSGATAASNPLVHDTNDGTSSNRLTTSVTATGTSISNAITTGGVAQFSGPVATTYTQNTVYKVALAATTNSAIAAVNGNLSTLDTSVTMPTVTSIRLGRSVFNGNYLTGHLRTLAYYNSRLPNSQLQVLTT